MHQSRATDQSIPLPCTNKPTRTPSLRQLPTGYKRAGAKLPGLFSFRGWSPFGGGFRSPRTLTLPRAMPIATVFRPHPSFPRGASWRGHLALAPPGGSHKGLLRSDAGVGRPRHESAEPRQHDPTRWVCPKFLRLEQYKPPGTQGFGTVPTTLAVPPRRCPRSVTPGDRTLNQAGRPVPVTA